MTEALIVSTARTPLCKSWRGAFNMTHRATLGAHAVRHPISPAGIDSAEVEDVIMGCANPEGATGGGKPPPSTARAPPRRPPPPGTARPLSFPCSLHSPPH